MTKNKTWRGRYQKKEGIEMQLFVDLMIANQGNKKVVNEKLDELIAFISKELAREYEKGKAYKGRHGRKMYSKGYTEGKKALLEEAKKELFIKIDNYKRTKT